MDEWELEVRLYALVYAFQGANSKIENIWQRKQLPLESVGYVA